MTASQLLGFVPPMPMPNDLPFAFAASYSGITMKTNKISNNKTINQEWTNHHPVDILHHIDPCSGAVKVAPPVADVALPFQALGNIAASEEPNPVNK